MTKKLLILLVFGLLSHSGVQAAGSALPSDANQSMAFWLPHVISPESDPLVAKAQDIYQRLTRAWDQTRLTPALHIVRSSSGPWAASLQDGNILLSKKALEVCFRYKGKAEHLLAFVLAHEMAHIRSNDLWHQKFFRLVGSQAPSVQRQLVQGIKNDIDNLERREAQADHDGIILMSTVGFDPFKIVDNKDFFTIWVENIWRHSCVQQTKHNHEKQACDKAKTRALRTKTQLRRALSQAVLYELGIQAMVAGQYSKAQELLQAFARDFPSRTVFEALGISHLLQAKSIHDDMLKKGLLEGISFYFPVVLNTHPFTFTKNKKSGVRGKNLAKQLQKKLERHANSAIQYFEKSKKIDPQYRKNYINLAFSYLLSNNAYMARGISQGQYEKKFGKDAISRIILALTHAFEGNNTKAITLLASLINSSLKQQAGTQTLPDDLLKYTLYRNYTSLLRAKGQHKKARATWQQLAKSQQKDGNSLLFEMAIGHIRNKSRHFVSKQHALIMGQRIGDKLKSIGRYKRNEIWFNGEKLQLLRYPNGAQLLGNSKNQILNAWQARTSVKLFDKISTGMLISQAVKYLGPPSRQFTSTSGQYLAYDDHGLALEVSQNKIAGWFLYESLKK